MKVDRSLEAFFVPEPAGVALDLLDHGVEAFGASVGRTGDNSSQDPLEMSLDRSRDLLDWFEPRTDGPVVPAHPGPTRPASDLVVPQAHRVGLDRPGSGGLEVGGLERLEAIPTLIGHVVRMLQPEITALDQHRIAFGQQSLVLGPANLVDGIAEVLGDMKLIEGDLVFRPPVVVKIDVALSMFTQPDFQTAFPFPGSATRLPPATSCGYFYSSAVGAGFAPPDRRHAAWPGSLCPARCGVGAG